MAFVYEERAVATAVARTTQDSGAFDRYTLPEFPTFNPSGGNSYVGRIGPPTWVGLQGQKADHYGYELWLNYKLGAEGGTYVSRSKMGLPDDAVVDLATRLRQSGDKYQDAVKALRAKKRVLVWWLGRGQEREGWKLWAMPWTFDKDLAKRCYSKATGNVLLIDHPVHGYDISFDVEGTGRNTKYTAVEVARRESPIVADDAERAKLLDYIVANPLHKTPKIYDNDYIANLLGGMDVDAMGAEREEDTDTDTPPAGAEGTAAADDDKTPVPDVRAQEGVSVDTPPAGRESLDDDDMDMDAALEEGGF